MTSGCSCCKGIGSLKSEPALNRPGLDVIRYRVATHASFLDRMIAALTTIGEPALEALATRAANDPSLALLDAWATVADVLTFYQERIANEGYLRTATERRSILELGRLVGYQLRPGVAASVYLAYTLEQGYEVRIPEGARAQSLPGPGELPQSFETSAPLNARDVWNYLELRKSRPTVIVPADAQSSRANPASSVDTLYLDGASANLKPNDRVLLMFNTIKPPTKAPDEPPSEPRTEPHARTVASAVPQAAAARTRVELLPEISPTDSSKKGDQNLPGATRLDVVIKSLKIGPAKRQLSPANLNRLMPETFGPRTDIAASLLTAGDPLLKETFYRAWGHTIVAPVPQLKSVDALRVKASLFGHNAPPKPVLNSQGLVQGTEEWPLNETRIVTVRLTPAEQEPSEVVLRARPIAAQVLEVSIRRGSDFGTVALEFVDTVKPAERNGFTVTLKRSGARSEVTISPDGQDRFGLKEPQRVVLEIPVKPDDDQTPSDIALRVSIVNGTEKEKEKEKEKDHAQTLRKGETVRYAVGARRVTIEFADSIVVTQELPIALMPDARTIITLDNTYDQILPDSWILIERLNADGQKVEPLVRQVKDTATLTKTAFNITAKVTQLTLKESWLKDDWLADHQGSLAAFRKTTVYAHNEPQQLAEEPITTDVEKGRIELQGLYDGLESGRWLIVTGERADIPGTDGVPGRELVMLARIEQDVERIDGKDPVDGSRTQSTLFLTDELAYKYKRDTVRIYANVVQATQGETRHEILGSGDGSRAFQQFTLKQPPLTYVAATSPSGVESTLEVRVNAIKWHAAATLVDAGSDDRCYTTQTDDAGAVTVVFGDGVHGARLPTGLQNVTSVYRNGIGKGGNVKRDQISLVTTRPLGVKEVINPLAASGGADPESRDDARGNVPLSLLALDRLVSVADYEAFTRAFAGIGKVKAARLTNGRRELVHLTIAGADDIPVDKSSDLYRHLNLALHRFGDPQLEFQVDSRELLFLIVSATVGLRPDYHWVDVERRLRAALLDAFSFTRRELGQDVVLSEVISVMHRVPGVVYAAVDVLDAVSSSELPDLLEKGKPGPILKKNRIVAELADYAKPERPADSAYAQSIKPAQPIRPAQPKQQEVRTIQPAQLAILAPDVPDTLILRGPEK